MELTRAERELLRQALHGVLASVWGIPCDPARWISPGDNEAAARALADHGFASLGGDDGGGLAELLLTMESLGQAACGVAVYASFMLNQSAAESKDVRLSETAAAVKSGDIRLAYGDLEEIQVGPTGSLSGSAFLDGAVGATHVLVGHRESDLSFVIPLDAIGVRISPRRAFGQLHVARLDLDAVIDFTDVPGTALPRDERNAIVCAGLTARALGAARRSLTLVTEYSKIRRQFGRPIGSFQAMHHRLADCHIASEAVSAALDVAAEVNAQGDELWRFYAHSAFAYAAERLPAVALDLQHSFGAIGYAEEHEAPRHFRRIHLDVLCAGGLRASCEAIAAIVLKTKRFPDRPLGEAASAFRLQVRAWLAESWGSAQRTAQSERPFGLRDRDADFARKAGVEGWAALTWPKELGGLGRTAEEQSVLFEEMERVGAPRFGAPIHASVIMQFGTEAQKREHLGRIRAGDGIYGIGYSEPDSGSDLASVRTSANWDGENWIIDGQKIWTTTYWGSHIWVLARTDPDATPPHAGLSLFIMPTSTPGISITTSETMYDGAFANIYFDSVHLGPEGLIGKVNEAWKIIRFALAVERIVISGTILGRALQAYDQFLTHYSEAPGQAENLLLVGSFGARLAIGQALAMTSITPGADDNANAVGAAVCKTFCSELLENLLEAAIQEGGVRWALSEGSPEAPHNGAFEQRLRHSIMHVISGGTNDVQRNLIARRGLGLPIDRPRDLATGR